MKTLLLIVLFLSLQLHSQTLPYWDSRYGYDLTGPESPPNSIITFNNSVYIGGYFKKLNSNTGAELTVNNIARYEVASWKNLLDGVNAPVSAMSVFKNKLYTAGMFTKAGNKSSNCVAAWNGSDWEQVEGIALGNISTLTSDANFLYVAGKFNSIAGVHSESIARFNGKSWLPLAEGIRVIPSPMNGPLPQINAIVHHANRIYVAGIFDTAGMVPAKNIAMWDGYTWHNLGKGLQGEVEAITVLNDGTVYATETVVNGILRTPLSIKRWNGIAWDSIPLPMQCSSINALANDGDELFIGGSFTIDNVKQDYGLAHWNKNSWNSIGGGVIGTIKTLHYNDGTLYCGGIFLKINGNIPCRNIAAYRMKEVISDTLTSKTNTIMATPNPSPSQTVDLTLSLMEDGYAYISIITQDGREIQTLGEAIYEKGLYHISWNTEGIASGIYHCIIHQHGTISTTTINIIK